MTNPDLKFAQASFAEFNTLSGIDFLRKMRDGGDRSPMAKLMDLYVTSVEDGCVGITATPSPKFYNPMMRVHGGFTATVLDTALGCAVMSKMPAGTGVGTIVLNINYVRKIEVSSGPLTATGQVLHAGRTMLTAEANLKDAAGKLYAHATGTFLVYPK